MRPRRRGQLGGARPERRERPYRFRYGRDRGRRLAAIRRSPVAQAPRANTASYGTLDGGAFVVLPSLRYARPCENFAERRSMWRRPPEPATPTRALSRAAPSTSRRRTARSSRSPTARPRASVSASSSTAPGASPATGGSPTKERARRRERAVAFARASAGRARPAPGRARRRPGGDRRVPHRGRARPCRRAALREGRPLPARRGRHAARGRQDHRGDGARAAGAPRVPLLRGRRRLPGVRGVRRRDRRARHPRRQGADPELSERARRLERTVRLGVRRGARPPGRRTARRRGSRRAPPRRPVSVGGDDGRPRQRADGPAGARVRRPPDRARPRLRDRGRLRGHELSEARRSRTPPLRLRAHEHHSRLDHAGRSGHVSRSTTRASRPGANRSSRAASCTASSPRGRRRG